MALVNCHECGTQVSTEARACPKCGAPPQPPAVPLSQMLVKVPEKSNGAKAWKILLGIFAGLITLAWLLGESVSQMSQISDEAQKQHTRDVIAKTDASREKQRTDFAANKAQIIASTDALIQAKDFNEARKFLAAYAAVQDADLDARRSTLAAHDKEVTEQRKQAQIVDLEKQIAKAANPGEAFEASKKLLALDPSNTNFQRRQKDAEAKFTKWLQASRAKQDLEGRRIFAQEAENRFLGSGLNVDVTAEGKNADVLRVKYVLASKAVAYQLGQDGSFLGKAWSLGFRKVILDDGYRTSFTWSAP